MPETPDLAAAARSHSVGIVGGGIGGLIVAWECVKVGMSVTLWDAGDIGGMTRLVSVDGARVDVAADNIERSEAVDEVLSAFGLTDKLVASATHERWLLQRTPVVLPESPALGIPASPFVSDVTSVIGWGAAWRAYLDRLKPVLTIGNAESLGELVSQRVGAKVRDKLVAPRTRAELGLDPADVLIDAALPELNSALTRAGSLSGGVGLLDVTPPSLSLAGGLGVLAEALRTRIEELGGTVHEHTPATSVERAVDNWTITTTVHNAETDADEPVETTVQHLVLATDGRTAHSLLVPLIPSLAADGSTEQTVVTLAVSGITATRGAGVYASDAASDVQRIDHVTAQWPSIERATGHEIVRVTLAERGADDDEAVQIAAGAVGEAYGATVTVIDSHVERFVRAQSRAARTHADRVAAIRTQAATMPHLDVVGAWIAGDTVRDVITDAMATAEAIRRRALFSV